MLYACVHAGPGLPQAQCAGAQCAECPPSHLVGCAVLPSTMVHLLLHRLSPSYPHRGVRGRIAEVGAAPRLRPDLARPQPREHARRLQAADQPEQPTC